MGIKIKSIKEVVASNGLKVLVHGPAGAGKTVLGATTGVPTLIISAEAGLLSIADAPDYIHATEIKSMAEMEEVYDFLLEHAHEPQYEWVIIDSTSEIAEVLLSEEKEKSSDPRKAYGNLQEEMTKMLRKFRDLPYYNIMMTCKQVRLVDDFAGITSYVPSMPGAKLGPQIPYLFDEVFALRVEKDEEGIDYRVIQTNRDIRYEAKDRSGKLAMYEKPNLKHIMGKINGDTPAADLKIFYWYHDPSDAVGFQRCTQEDFNKMLSEGDVEEITKEQYEAAMENRRKEREEQIAEGGDNEFDQD